MVYVFRLGPCSEEEHLRLVLAISDRDEQIERLREALERISRPGYGLDTNANLHECAEYWENVALGCRKIARASLSPSCGNESMGEM